MNLFRKCLFILLLFCNSFVGLAQKLGDFDISRGVAPFYLGSSRTDQDSSFRLVEVGKLEYKGRTEVSYSYSATSNHPYIFGGVNFKMLLLTYVADTLIRITLSSIYSPKLYPDYDKRAKQEFRQVCKYLKEQWNSSGRKSMFYQSPDKRIISEGLKWNMDGKTMKVALYEDKSKAHRLCDISIALELTGYD